MICAQFTYIFWFLGLKHIIVTYNQGGEIVDIFSREDTVLWPLHFDWKNIFFQDGLNMLAPSK